MFAKPCEHFANIANQSREYLYPPFCNWTASTSSDWMSVSIPRLKASASMRMYRNRVMGRGAP